MKGNVKNRKKYNKKIFLLISFNFFPSALAFFPPFERMSKAGFLLTPTQTTHFLGSMAQEEARTPSEKRLSKISNHYIRI